MRKILSTFIIILAISGITAFIYTQGGYASMMGEGYKMQNTMDYRNPNNYSDIKLLQGTERGKVLFESLCSSCHGQYAQGNYGPNIQGASIREINWALNNVGIMKSLKDNPKLKNISNLNSISNFLQTIKKQGVQ